jgi:hypothetical protein
MSGPFFHYTNQPGLRGIIETKSLWFTDIFCLNDSTELNYALNLIQEELDKRMGEADKDSAGHETLQFLKTNCDYQEILRTSQNEVSLYVFSMTTESDDLSQWRAYGDNGVGYCIEFDLPKLLDNVGKRGGRNIITAELAYNDAEQRLRIGKIIDDEYRRSLATFFMPNRKDGLDGVIDYFRKKLFLAAIRIKHPKFEAENEVRLVILEDKKEKKLPLKFRLGTTMMIPYLDVGIADENDKMPINCIIIGPTSRQTLSEMVVRDLLRANSIECDVVPSKIPYRARL